MSVDPANASEPKQIAAEIGADVLEGALSYPSETGGWQLGDLDLSEYLDRFRNQRLVIVIAPGGEADPGYLRLWYSRDCLQRARRRPAHQN